MKKRIASAFLAVLLTTALLTIPAQAYSIDELTTKSGLDYIQVGAFSEGYATVVKDVDGDGHPEYGLMDSHGTLVVPFKYDYIGTVSEGFVKIGVDADGNPDTGRRWVTGGKGVEKFGFIDVTGKEIVSPVHDSVEDFHEGMAAVSTMYLDHSVPGLTFLDPRYGFVDSTGKLVIPIIYKKIAGVRKVSDFGGLGTSSMEQLTFSEGVASVCKDGKWGVINKQGNTIIPFEYEVLGGFSDGLARACINGKYGYIDKKGQMVIPATYDLVNDFSEGFAVVGKKDAAATGGYRYGFINKQGTLIAPMEYEAIGSKFSEGLIQVATASRDSSGKWNGWKWGFLNTEGMLVVPMIYYSVCMYSEGLSLVNIPEGWDGSSSSAGKNRYGFIDKQGNVVIPLKYEYAGSFSDGLAAVGTAIPAKYGYIDKNGTEVIPKTTNQYGINEFSGGVAVAYDKKSGMYSIIKNPLSTSQTPSTTPTEPADTTPSFTDVPAGEWYADPVAWAVEKEITSGTGNNAFSPNKDCTHSEILTFLWRAAGKPESKAEAPIKLNDSDWYAGAVRWATEKGMIGKDFDLNKPCTRAEAVNYIWKAFDEPSAKTSNFTDVPANATYAKAVNWAVEKEVTKGTNPEGTMFSPNEICTRGHIVTFLYRAYNK